MAKRLSEKPFHSNELNQETKIVLVARKLLHFVLVVVFFVLLYLLVVYKRV